MPNTTHIFECHFHKPQENFSRGKVKQNHESKFAEQFAKAYQAKFLNIHAGTCNRNTLFIREVPVSGNGIADLLVLSWSDSRIPQKSPLPDFEELNPTVRAFEFKLSDWRKGLMQAHRYKYFSHASILVLPNHKIKSIKSQLDIFRKLRIGLWGFKAETKSINRLYTPRPVNQQIPQYRQKAIRLVEQTVCSQFGPLSKLPQTIQ